MGQRAEAVLTPTGIPRVDMFRVTEPTQLFPEIYQPFVSFILQGEKRLLIGNKGLSYAAGDAFIASVDLPATGEIVEASITAPYLAVRLTFDLAVIADLLRDVPEPMNLPETQSFCIAPVHDDLIDAWLRMLRLMDQPDDIAVMAPLLEREILFRLLRGRQGAILRQAASINGRFSQIRKALIWIRTNHSVPVRIEDLAHIADMSVSAFHRSFKASTGLSPLQYQKHLRLYEARRILFAKPGDVASVAFGVGYESLSQFTREYARMFGAPPARDIRNLQSNSSRKFAATGFPTGI
ncbi:MAG: AraC family transcriptional regulator [Pseudorhizobium sp.]